MSTIKTKKVQVGTDSTASNNFTIYTPGTPDGTVRIGNGNADSPTDRVTVTSAGNVGIGTSSPSVLLHLKGSNFSSAIRWEETGGSNNFYAGPINTTGDFGIDNNSTSGYIRFATNSAERMRIDSSGRVTMPYQPAFLATKNTSNLSTTGGGVKIPLDYTVFNTGNHFNTSTNTFTCPVSGKYLFMWQGYQNGSAQLRIDLYKNGARYVGGYIAISAGDGFSSSVLLDAAANDTVYLTLESASTTLYYGGVNPHTYLTGYLLG